MAYQQQQQGPGPVHYQIPPMSDAKDEMMWTGHADSGFTSQMSGVHTPALSVFDEDAPGMIFEWERQAFTQDDPNTTVLTDPIQQNREPPVIQTAIFQEPMEEGLPEIAQTPVQDHSQRNNVPRGPESTHTLRHAVHDLFSQQNDADLATKAIPDLVFLLQDDDQVVVGQAAMMVHQLSKKDELRPAIIAHAMRSPAMVVALVRVLDQSTDLEVIKSATGILNSLSHIERNRDEFTKVKDRERLYVIFKPNVIHTLVRLLSSPIESILFHATTTLHNLLLNLEESRAIVRQADALPRMVAFLRRDNVKFLAIVADCLQILAYGNADAKLKILASGGVVELIRIMRQYSYEKLLMNTTRVLKVLSVCQQNKPAIVQASGMQALSMHLTNSNKQLVLNCLWTLRNLSDCATKYETVDQRLAQSLILLLKINDINIVTCAAGILSNLTCNNQQNKTVICKEGGVEALIQTISCAEDREDIIEPAVCALRHLTTRHQLSNTAQNTVRGVCDLAVVVNLLNQSRSWPLIKAVIGLIRNLALSTLNHSPLRERGAIPRLVDLLNKALQESQFNPVSNGVHMEHIIEGTVGALHTLAKDSLNRGMIRALSVVPTFVQLLCSNSENIQRVTVGVLCELTADEEGVKMINSAGASSALRQLQNSPNEAIASYATTVLYHTSEGFNNRNRSEMFGNYSMDMNNSMFRSNEQNQWCSPMNGDITDMICDEPFMEPY